jgi:hypothetical protein
VRLVTVPDNAVQLCIATMPVLLNILECVLHFLLNLLFVINIVLLNQLDYRDVNVEESTINKVLISFIHFTFQKYF